MKYLCYVLACLFLWQTIASAQAAGGKAPPTAELWVLPDGRETLSIQAICSDLAHPAPSADYVPGVDVNGSPVAPADLTPGPYVRDIPIILRHRVAGANASAGRVAGLVTVHDGIVLFNGVPLAADDQAALAAACRNANR